MWATIAAMAVQITTTQIVTAMAAEISDIVSSFTWMILLLSTVRGRIPGSTMTAAITSVAIAAA